MEEAANQVEISILGLKVKLGLMNAIESLNDRQRLAVLLHKFEGMSYSDIGLSMDLTPQAVKSLLSRARENLKIHLKKYVSN